MSGSKKCARYSVSVAFIALSLSSWNYCTEPLIPLCALCNITSQLACASSILSSCLLGIASLFVIFIRISRPLCLLWLELVG